MIFPIRSLAAAVMSTLLAGGIGAVPAFVPPSEEAPPFRRDRLPIDTDTMVSLSQSMTLLSQASNMDEAAQRRAAAQALAIALALDPANSSARDVLSSIAEEKRLREPDPEKLDRAKNQVWQLNGWLATPEAGTDGNLLADLLGDAAATLAPDHPSASEWKNAGERGKWDGWVAPVAAFQEHKAIIPPTVAKNDPAAGDEPDSPGKTPDAKASSGLKPSSASIRAVLYRYEQATDSYVLGPVTVSMESKTETDHGDGGEGKEGEKDREGEEDREDREGEEHHEGGAKRGIRINCHETVESDVFEKVTKPILRALGKLHNVKEDGLAMGSIRINTGKAGTYSFRRNGDDMTGPGFILANAAITGIAPDAFFIGTLDREGEKLELPDLFWKKLSTLIDESPGGRLVVSAAAEEYMTALLAMEKPDFFMNYEVLVASSPQEAVRLCAMNPDPELAAILAKFKEIKDKSDTAALGSYLANVHVRKRLVEISQAAPYHLSAKLLAIQGAGARPRAITKKILAAEILEAIWPLDEFAEMDIWELNAGKVAAMEKAMEVSRDRLGLIERYVEMRDRELLKDPENVIADLRAMVRITRDRRELWEKSDEISRAHRTFRDANRELRRELALLTGDTLPRKD